MLWENTDLPQARQELPLEQRYAGFSAGDNWVCAFKVSVDEMGGVTPYACSYKFIKCPRSMTLPVKQLGKVLRECWEKIDEGDQLDWGGFIWILPPWALRSREVEVELPMSELAGAELPGPVAVMREDRDAINRRAVEAATEAGWTLTEMIPHCYVLNGRRKLADPVGESARSLGLRAHAVMAEESALKGLLDATRACGIEYIDALLSPAGISSAHLSTVEKRRDMALVDIDRESSSITLLQEGRVVASANVTLGSYLVLHETAASLQMSPRDFGQWLNDHEEAFVSPSRSGEPPVFSPFQKGPGSLAELDEACLPAGERLFEAIYEKIKHLNFRMGSGAHDIVVTGDDYLACRAVRAAGSRLAGLRCSWRRPRGQRLLLQKARRVPGLARVVGAMQRAGVMRDRIQVPVLDDFNKTVVDRFNDRLAGIGKRFWQRWRRRPLRRVAAMMAAGVGKLVSTAILPREQPWQVHMRRRRNSRFSGQFILR